MVGTDATPAPAGVTLLDVLDLRSDTEPALSPDGVRWLTVGDLLRRARTDAAALGGPGPGGPGSGPGAALVPGDDPVGAVRALLAAQFAGALPVVGPVDGASAGAVGARQRLLDQAAAYAADQPDGEPLLVVVTSGSGGSPRAVVRTARSWQVSLPGFDDVLGPAVGPDAVVWVPGPPSSTLTLFGLWHALATGRPVVAPGPWHASRSAATGAGAQALQCVPTLLDDVLDARSAGLLPRLRRIVVAGAPLSGGSRARAAAEGITLAEYYGAAELSFCAADTDGTGLRAFPGTELEIRDDVVWVRSPYLSRGYLQEPGPSAALRRDGRGWATVGDLATLSPGGVLTVRGRGDGTATVGGATVTLADVEQALRDLDGVAELVALAEPDPRLGEHVLVVVQPRTPGDGDELVARLRAAARVLLLPAARPVRYAVREQLPRLPGGKVARAALLAEVRAGRHRTLTS